MVDPSRNWRAWAAPVTLYLTVIAFAAGSSSVREIKADALPLRWVTLFVLCGVGLSLLWGRLRERPAGFVVLPGIFLALALLSTFWSVDPRISFEKTGTLGVLFLAAAAIAHASRLDLELRRRVLFAPGAAAATIALIGFAMLFVDHAAAVQQAAATSPWRFRGFGENPNTIPLLAAVTLPSVAWALLRATGTKRGWWAVALASLLATCIATESRGGLIGAFIGVAVVFALLVDRPLRKLASVATVAVLCAGGVVLRQTVQPPPPVNTATSTPVVPQATPGGHPAPGTPSGHPVPGARFVPGGATTLPARIDEIGNPAFGAYTPTTVGSGRVAEWEGVLHTVVERPLLGFGFGTEAEVFVDRWYYFDGGTAENSYLGVLLQLGAVGLAVLASIGLALVPRVVRAIRLLRGDERAVVVTAFAALVAAAVLMTIQSYIYSIGNVASVSTWVTIFILGDAVWAFGRRRAHEG